jgi:hypothetical protein
MKHGEHQELFREQTEHPVTKSMTLVVQSLAQVTNTAADQICDHSDQSSTLTLPSHSPFR